MPHFQPADSDELSSCKWDSAPVSETELNEELRTQCKQWTADEQQSVQTTRRRKAPPAGKYRAGFSSFRMRATKVRRRYIARARVRVYCNVVFVSFGLSIRLYTLINV
jgi:hypothetical protein